MGQTQTYGLLGRVGLMWYRLVCCRLPKMEPDWRPMAGSIFCRDLVGSFWVGPRKHTFQMLVVTDSYWVI